VRSRSLLDRGSLPRRAIVALSWSAAELMLAKERARLHLSVVSQAFGIGKRPVQLVQRVFDVGRYDDAIGMGDHITDLAD
jgi:hypothetical protein